MGLFSGLRRRTANLLNLGSEDDPATIGIYGPPNAGKSTLANRILQDWDDSDGDGEIGQSTSEVPHETRSAERHESITIEQDGQAVELDIVDTPGVDTKVDENDFKEYGLDQDAARSRSREATEGIAEAMHWLREDIDGVIYVVDSCRDPFTQTNQMIVGIIESQDMPVVILANKIDDDDASVTRVKNAWPQHETIPVSVLEGDNMSEAYEAIAETFN